MEDFKRLPFNKLSGEIMYDRNIAAGNNCGDKEKNDNSGPFIEKELLEQRKIIISSGVDQKLAEATIKKLLYLDSVDSEKPITVIINSPGGEVFSGFAIFDVMKAISAPVYTLVTGFAASMGSIIMLGAEEGKRFATKNSKVLIHQPLIGGFFQGRATEIEIQAKEIQETKDRIINLYESITGQEREKIAKDIEVDYWMTAEDALEYGLINKIIDKLDDIG